LELNWSTTSGATDGAAAGAPPLLPARIESPIAPPAPVVL
jgi:hypothetical protein